MKRSISKKHHYLPRYYLKGFTNNKDIFFVYDKQADKIFLTSPSGSFFENNLNTIILPNGKASDFLESLYAEIENESWQSIDSVRTSTPSTPINPLDKMNLFLFLLFLHWRLPSNIEFGEKLSKHFSGSNNQLDYFKLKSKTGSMVPIEVIDSITSTEAFKKTAKVIAPFAPFFKNPSWWNSIEKWRFFYSGDGGNWFIVGDNPIITKGDRDHDPVNCLNEFIFPVSGKILLVNSNKDIFKNLPREFLIQFNIAIIERAQRFVACQNKDFLEALIKNYNIYVQYGKTKNIIEEMFDMLYQ